MTHFPLDLVAKSKSFGSKSGPTSVATRVANFNGCAAARLHCDATNYAQQKQQLNRSSAAAAATTTTADLAGGLEIESANYNQYKHNQHLAGAGLDAREDNCYAFDNPYFSDARKDWLLAQQVHQQQQQQQQQQQRYLSQAESPDAQQLHFIEHRISTLHNRQVTSSVNELAGNVNLAERNNCDQRANAEPLYLASHAAQVVDLTSASERAKVLADPKQGDLIAVDLTGHDFIGLGFDVCGNERNGIYVKSVLARGPARDSGCIEPGDRIKCLNIAFDNITLSDACDLLNCAAPYKMRLLLEKRALDSGEDLRKLSTASSALVAARGERNSWAPMTNMHPLALGDLTTGAEAQPQLPASHRSQRPTSMPYGCVPVVGEAAAADGAGPLKTYLRRLSRLVAPNNDWLGNGQDQAAQRRADADPYPLGSAAARIRAHQSYMYPSGATGAPCDALMSPVGLTNVGFCHEADGEDDNERDLDDNHSAGALVAANKRPLQVQTDNHRDIPLLRVDQQRNKLQVDTRMDLSKLGQEATEEGHCNDISGNDNDNDNDGYYSDGDTQVPHSISPAMSLKNNLPGQLLPAQGRLRRQTVAGLCETVISSQLVPGASTNVSTSASKLDPITSVSASTSTPHCRRSTDAVEHSDVNKTGELTVRASESSSRSDPEIVAGTVVERHRAP